MCNIYLRGWNVEVGEGNEYGIMCKEQWAPRIVLINVSQIEYMNEIC